MIRKKRLLLTTVIVLAVLLACTCVAFAYFTDYEDAHGGAVVRLEGESELHETPEDDRKIISIENTGETDIIVRVAVFGDYVTEEADEGDWIKDGDYWYYKHILEPGKSTSEIIASIDVEKAKEEGHDFEIVVVHEIERVTYDGTEENKVVKPEGWAYPDIAAGMPEEVNG